MSATRYTVPATTSSNALSLSKTKGTPSVKIAFRSVPTEDGEQPRTLFADLWLTDAAFEATVRTLREVFRWEGNDLSELNAPILQGIEVDLVCEVEGYTDAQQQPREREVVKFINLPGAGGAGGVKALDGMDAANLCSSLNARLASIGRQATTARQGSARQGSAAGQNAGAAAGVSRPPQNGLAQGRQGASAPRGGRGSAPAGADDFPGFAPPQDGGGEY